MTNGEKYKTDKTRKSKYSDFCFDSPVRPCDSCTAYEEGKNCFDVWLSLDCTCGTELTKRTDARIEREKRVQEVALIILAQNAIPQPNCDYMSSMAALELADDFVEKCEQREKLIKEGGAE